MSAAPTRPDQAGPLPPPSFALAVVNAIEEAERHAEPGEPPLARSDRARFAIARLFAGDEAAARSAWLRFNAVMHLHDRGTLGDWERGGPGGTTQFHPAVLDAASQLRLSANGRFGPRKFLGAVADIGRAHYADFEGWPLPGSRQEQG